MSTSKKRVVVTGMGLVSPCGNNVEDSWRNIVAGKPGIDRISSFDVSDFSSQVGGEVKNFDPLDYLEKKESRRMDRYVHLAVAASQEAMKELEGKDFDGENFGTIVGSGIGGISTFETQHSNYADKGPSRISPFFIPMMISDMASGILSIRYGLKGPNFCTVSACASGGHGIATSFMTIQNGYCKAVLTGGAEATISPMALGGFCSMKALSTRNDDPVASSRPFDVGRDGFVMAEGSGIILLEELEHALDRGATIYAELKGVGMTGDAYHMTSPVPGGVGAAQAMRMALEDAGLKAGEIDYINAHGTSTLYNDKAESEAINSVFGRANGPHVSSTKSCSGHLLGAAAGLEFIVSVKTLLEQTMPPTANLEEIDPECPLNHVPQKALQKDMRYVMSNSFGFGGHNVSLVIAKYE
ncbi:MAG: beta-ketoacyl-ACP synthase II [Candidatus Krumholzibacteriota bacterium]|nr:beta-ketoacyl-ACP synthase II [Candidatus Krumholzibacteriota bacterium]